MVRTTLITTLLVALPLVAGAQQPRARAPRAAQPQAGRAFRDPSATELLNRRRELDLTPRQVARLDSIERAQYARGRSLAQDLQRLRDSACGDRQCTPEQRQSLRDRLLSLREQRMDTSARRLAISVLDSTQRGRVQGWQMSRRRAAMSQRMQRGMGRQGFAGPRGGQRFRGEFGPRGGFAPRQGFGPGPGRFREPGVDAPRLRERVGPGMGGRRPMGPMRQRRPGDELGAPPAPRDSTSR